MRNKIIIACLVLVLCAVAIALHAGEKTDRTLLVKKLQSYFDNFVKLHPDPKFPGIHAEIVDKGQVPDSPFSLFEVRFSDQENHSVGKNNVITDGKFMFPSSMSIVNLENSKEIAQAYLTKINRVSIEPERTFLVGGNPEAEIKVVFFSDYECPYCKVFAHSVIPRLVGRQDLAVYHYELPLVGIHHNAEYLARVAVAYRKVMSGAEVPADFYGKNPSEIPVYIQQLSGDKKEDVLREADADATKETVKKCVDLAAKLEINATPTVLVNGYRANPTSGEIEALIARIQHKEL